MQSLLSDPRVAKLAHKPAFEAFDTEKKRYKVFNLLERSFITVASDSQQKHYAAFSCFVKNVHHIAREEVYPDGTSTPLWVDVRAKGMFKLPQDHKLHIGTSAQHVTIEIDEDVFYMDVFTAELLHEQMVQMVLDENDKLRIKHADLKDGFKSEKKRNAEQKALYERKINAIVAANSIIEKSIKAIQSSSDSV
jgi:hypothetical protein